MFHERSPVRHQIDSLGNLSLLSFFREELERLGPLSTDEKLTAGALLITVGLWIFGGQLGIGSVAAALLGLAIMLVTNVITWKECLSNNAAWDTLTWFAALIGMASYLNKYGFIKWFSDQVGFPVMCIFQG